MLNTDELANRIIDSMFCGKKTYKEERYVVRDDAVYHSTYLVDENKENPVQLKEEEVYLRRDVLENALKNGG